MYRGPAAPISGATATFSGSFAITVTTNAAGVAVSPVPVANSTTGSYSVTASVAGITTPATFNLTNTAASTSVTIWYTAPTAPFYAEATPVEVGVKFGDVSGTITGVRFYKASSDNTTHTGSLWSSNGTRLATGTFTGGTASGWQQLNFSAPVGCPPQYDLHRFDAQWWTVL